MKTFGDRIKETTTTTGTGNIALLGPETNYVWFNKRFDLNVPFEYAIIHRTASEWEVGTGYLSAAFTLIRDKVTASSNDGALVNFSSGTKDVINTITASYVKSLPTVGDVLANTAAIP